jgi:hypothetical protein
MDQINTISQNIKDLDKQRIFINGRILQLENRQKWMFALVDAIDSEKAEEYRVHRIGTLNNDIRNIIFECDYDITRIKEIGEQQIDEMMLLNPYYNIDLVVKHITDMKRRYY